MSETHPSRHSPDASRKPAIAKRLWALAMAVYGTTVERHVSLIAAGVAFFGMFALFPAIAAIIAIFGLLADPTIVVQQLELVKGIIPDETYLLFVGQMGRLLAAQTGTLGFASGVSLLLAYGIFRRRLT